MAAQENDRRFLARITRTELADSAVKTVDEAKFSGAHIRYPSLESFTDSRTIFVAGIGLYLLCRPSHLLICVSFTDSYQFFAVAFAIVMFSHVYDPQTGELPSSSATAIKISSSVGAVLGQCGFGILTDVLGRKKVYLFAI